MKITQEVREFARLNPSPLEGEARSLSEREGEGASSPATVEAGMAEMSKRFHDEGGELYVPAAE
jgi:phosphomethylpyrimidine synthase